MSCLQLVNSLIDLGKLAIATRHLGFPETYSEIFTILNRNKIIDEDDLELAKKMIYLRNLISHEKS